MKYAPRPPVAQGCCSHCKGWCFYICLLEIGPRWVNFKASHKNSMGSVIACVPEEFLAKDHRTPFSLAAPKLINSFFF